MILLSGNVVAIVISPVKVGHVLSAAASAADDIVVLLLHGACEMVIA